MNPALYTSAGVTALAEEAFKLYADTLDYKIIDISLRHTTKPFVFRLHWKCAETNGWADYRNIKLAFQELSLQLFKYHGYVVVIDDPEVEVAP